MIIKAQDLLTLPSTIHYRPKGSLSFYTRPWAVNTTDIRGESTYTRNSNMNILRECDVYVEDEQYYNLKLESLDL